MGASECSVVPRSCNYSVAPLHSALSQILTSTEHLIRRHQTWYVRVQIPAKLWGAAKGRREFVKSLGTRDLAEANNRKHAHIAEYKRQIKALEQARRDPLRKMRMRALALRDAIDEAKGEGIYFEGDPGPTDVAGVLQSEALDEIREMAGTVGEEEAARLARMLKSTTPPLIEYYERWLDQQVGDITKQTAAQHRMAVREFLRWAGEEVCIGDVDRKLAGEYTNSLLHADSGLSRKTTARRLSSLSSLWSWLEDRGLAPKDSNPWLRQLRGKRGKRGREKPRSQWKDEQLVKLLAGEMTPQYTTTLHDLVRLALVTGARLDELCSLQAADAVELKDGWWLKISEGKTQAAVREVPIHDSAAHVVKGRRKTSDGFLFPGLAPGGPDAKRSWNVSKAFGRYCAKLGLSDKALVFHSLRRTFTEALEAAEVLETTTKLLIGHARSSQTYGGYSKGERVNLREAICKLKYSPAVMVAIRRSEAVEKKPRRGARQQ